MAVIYSCWSNNYLSLQSVFENGDDSDTAAEQQNNIECLTW